jgi:hypothetical protein
MLVAPKQLQPEEEHGEDIEFSDGEDLTDSDRSHQDAVDELDFDFGDHILSVCQALGGFEHEDVNQESHVIYKLGVEALG